MDYGQPLSNNDCMHCCGHGEPAHSLEPQFARKVEEPIPDWIQVMLDQIPDEAYETSLLQPVSNVV